MATNEDAVFIALLTSSTPLMAALPGGIHWDEAPLGADEPHLIVTVADDTENYALGQTVSHRSILYLLRIVADGQQGRERASNIVPLIATALRFFAPSIPGWTRTSISQRPGGRRYSDNDGFWNHAVYYRLWLGK